MPAWEQRGGGSSEGFCFYCEVGGPAPREEAGGQRSWGGVRYAMEGKKAGTREMKWDLLTPKSYGGSCLTGEHPQLLESSHQESSTQRQV